MTVRINKPALNLREKLAELDKPSGIVGEQILRSDTAEDAREALNLEEHLFEDFESTGIQDNATSTKVTVDDTGVDVTGTVTADGLTVDGAVDSAPLVISTAYGTAGEKYSAIRFNNKSFAGGDSEIRNVVNGASSVGSALEFHTEHTGAGDLRTRLNIANNGDVSFYEDTGTTAKMVWDASAERLGIGTTSPDGDLDIRGTGLADLVVRATSANSTSRVLMQNDAQSFALRINGDDKFRIKDETADADRLVVDLSGNVGIGTASPRGPLHVYGADYAYFASNVAGVTPYSTQSGIALGWNKSSGGGESVIAHNKGAGAIGGLVFVNNDAGAYREDMRLDNSGNLLVGTTANTNSYRSVINSLNNTNGLYIGAYTDNEMLVFHSRYAQSSGGVRFKLGAVGSEVDVGSITFNSLGTSYNTSSDRRLKENIQDTTHAVNIDDIQVREFDWKVDGSHQRYGFIAQELETVYPEAVSTDASEEQMKSVDYSKLVPLLVKEIQTLKTRIETLENN